jgi:hypothetical protein
MADDWLKKIHDGRRRKREREELETKARIERGGIFDSKSGSFFRALSDEMRRLLAAYNVDAEPDARVEINVVAGPNFRASWNEGPSVLEVGLNRGSESLDVHLQTPRRAPAASRAYKIEVKGTELHVSDYSLSTLAEEILGPFLVSID